MVDDAYDLMVGEAAARLKANVDFEVFQNEIRRRRELLVDNTMGSACESFEEYLAAQGEYKSLTVVLDMPDQLTDVALDIREQHNV